MNILAKSYVVRRPWCTVMTCCLFFIFGARTSDALEYVFSTGSPIPDLGIASYDGYADVRFNDDFPNSGAGAELIFAGNAGNGAINRALVRWDLSALDGATILGDATLTMRVTQVSQDALIGGVPGETVDGNDYFDFHRIVDTNAGWVENGDANIANGDAIDGDPSWNNFSQTPLQPWRNATGVDISADPTTGIGGGLGDPGEGYEASPAFFLNQPDYTATPNLDVQITVPQAVIEDIIAGGANHPGFLLRHRGDEIFGDLGRIRFSADKSLHSLTIDADVPIQVAELEIDRTTGAMTLVNNTGGPIDFKSYSITSGVGALNATEWARVADADWEDTSATTTELSEAETPFVNGKQLTSGGATIPLGDAWIQSPNEDVMMELVLNDDSTQTVAVSFVGNGDAPLAFGDLNFMDGVTEDDWPIFKAGFDQDLTGLSQAQRYGMGDLNNDGVNDHADFILFKTAFDDAQGAGAFAAMVAAVPEPSTASLVLLSVVAMTLLPRRGKLVCSKNEQTGKVMPIEDATRPPTQRTETMQRNTRLLALLLVGAVTLVNSSAHAIVINIDYGREENETTGNWNNVSGPGGTQVLGTPSVALIDDTGAPTGILLNTSFAEGGSFAGAGADYPATGTGTPADYPAAVASFPISALEDSGFIRTQSPLPTGAFTTFTFTGLNSFTSYDFLFYGARGNNGGQAVFDVTGGDGTMSASIADVLNNSTSVATVNGVMADENDEITVIYSSDFSPESTTENRAGLNVIQVTATPLAQPTIEVNTSTGEVTMLNDTATSFDINFYEVISPMGALKPAQGAWDSFEDQDLEAGGPPSGTGDGWEELGTPHTGKVAEAYLQGSLMLSNGDEESLGNLFDTSVFGPNIHGDLVFNVGLTDDSFLPGKVVYVSGPGLPGDFNGDGKVNLADYTVWRNNLGASSDSVLPPGSTTDGSGIVDAGDYTTWKNNFGAGTGSTIIAQTSVPEPCSAIILVAACLSGVAALRSRRL